MPIPPLLYRLLPDINLIFWLVVFIYLVEVVPGQFFDWVIWIDVIKIRVRTLKFGHTSSIRFSNRLKKLVANFESLSIFLPTCPSALPDVSLKHKKHRKNFIFIIKLSSVFWKNKQENLEVWWKKVWNFYLKRTANIELGSNRDRR